MTGQPVYCKISTVVLGVVMGAWLSAPAFAATAQVRAIRVSEAGGDTAIVISATAQPTFTTWKLEQPARWWWTSAESAWATSRFPWMPAPTPWDWSVRASAKKKGRSSDTRCLDLAAGLRLSRRGARPRHRCPHHPHLRPAASQAASPDSHAADIKAEARLKAERAEEQAKPRRKLGPRRKQEPKKLRFWPKPRRRPRPRHSQG